VLLLLLTAVGVAQLSLGVHALVTGLCTSCPLLYSCVCVGHAKAECVLLLRRLHRRLACYWPAAGRCRAVGSPRSAGGTWLAAHFAGANNSNHPHSAAPFGKGPTIWEGAPGRFGEGPWADAGKCDERLQTRAVTGGSRRQQGGRGALAMAIAMTIAIAVAVAVAVTVHDGSSPGLAGQGVEQPPPHSPLWPTRGPAGRADGALLGRTGCGRPVTPWVLTRRQAGKQAGRTQERARRDKGSKDNEAAAVQRYGTGWRWLALAGWLAGAGFAVAGARGGRERDEGMRIRSTG
jgi:hypothetical protein